MTKLRVIVKYAPAGNSASCFNNLMRVLDARLRGHDDHGTRRYRPIFAVASISTSMCGATILANTSVLVGRAA
jgi:hypothetical protein